VAGAVDVVDFDEFREVVDRRSQKLS
jgi:hypothetical protein